jgi:hypothetical protein
MLTSCLQAARCKPWLNIALHFVPASSDEFLTLRRYTVLQQMQYEESLAYKDESHM